MLPSCDSSRRRVKASVCNSPLPAAALMPRLPTRVRCQCISNEQALEASPLQLLLTAPCCRHDTATLLRLEHNLRPIVFWGGYSGAGPAQKPGERPPANFYGASAAASRRQGGAGVSATNPKTTAAKAGSHASLEVKLGLRAKGSVKAKPAAAARAKSLVAPPGTSGAMIRAEGVSHGPMHHYIFLIMQAHDAFQ